MAQLTNAFEHDQIRSRGDYKEFLAADLQAHNLSRWFPILSAILHPELGYQRALRRAEYAMSMRGPLGTLLVAWRRYRLSRLSLISGISIPPRVFGRGLSIAHYGSIVVNNQAQVEQFCRIHSATNIGLAGGGAPQIGSSVYIAPGAVIFGRVHIGDGAVIGANAVVGRDVEANTTVGGSPARVISRRDSTSVMPDWMSFPLRSREGRP